MTTRRRLLTRNLSIDFDRLARSLLLGRHEPNEVVLEVYRWMAVTMDEHGVQYREQDPWSHRRYKHIRDVLGLEHPSRWGFGLRFTQSSREYWPQLREAIVRAAFGDTPDLLRWRADQGFPNCQVACRVLKRVDGRRRDPLDQVYSNHPCRGYPHVKDPPRLNLSFNSHHKRCRTLFAFVLVPEADGWKLAVSFGGATRRNPDGMWTVRAREWAGSPCDDIPEQGPDESANEFFERSCIYMRSILVVQREPTTTGDDRPRMRSRGSGRRPLRLAVPP